MSNEYHFDRIVIIGAGGVGFHLAVALARDQRDVPVDVWDDDTFEKGLGALRLPHVSDKSQAKVNFLLGHIAMVMDDFPPGGYNRKVTAEDAKRPDYWDKALVMDCTDMPIEPRRELWDALTKAGATLMRVSYDGNGTIVVSPGLPFTGRKGGGYGLVPTLGQSYVAGGMGAMAVMKAIKTGYLTDMQITISDKEDSK